MVRCSQAFNGVIPTLLLFLALFTPTFLLGQAGGASISGRISDPAGRMIPAANLSIKSMTTDVMAETTTNNDGVYSFSSLTPGEYVMSVSKRGFRTVNLTGLTIYTQDELNRNVTLDVGAASESVTVTAEVTNVSPAVSMTVTREFIENIPLNGGSFQDLLQLAPGAVNSAGYFSINGQRTDANNYSVDGVSANLGGINNTSVAGSQGPGLSGSSPSQTALGTTQSLASIDALQEFKIQTSGYAAEYGRSPGGQVQLTTRSGNNNLHGTLFDYLRNTVFDANSYSNNYRDLPKTAEHQNDFGGTVGGPLMIPKLSDGRGKTFYFFSYEGLRLLLPAFESEHVPTQALRSWASPQIQPVLNAAPLPSPSSPGNQDGCTITEQPTGQPAACDALFNYGYSYPEKLDNISLRIDQNLGSRLHAFLRYAYTPSSEVTGAEKTRSIITNTDGWTAGLTAKITGTILNDLRFNASSDKEFNNNGQRPVGGSIPMPRSVVIPPQYDSPAAYGEFSVSVPGSSLKVQPTIGSSGTNLRQYQVTDSISWLRSRHALKFGVDWRRIASTYSNQTYSPFLVTSSLVDIQRGYATTAQISASIPGSPVFDNLSVYAQDHWQVTPRITLDYGLRWEFNPPPGPSNGHYPAVLTSSDLATATLAPAGTPPYATTYNHFAPRFGFAWSAIPSPSHALTVRGGFGMFYDTGQQAIGNAYAQAYPFTATGPTLKEAPLPLASSAAAPPSLDFPLVAPYSFIYPADPDLTVPYTEQWNLSVDYALNAKNTLTTSYVGNNGRKLLYTQEYEGAPEENPDFPSGLQFTSNGSQSNYHSIQFQDMGRLSRDLEMVGSFTWAHALDNSSTDDSIYPPQWGNSNYDLRRTLNLALNYSASPSESNGWMRALTSGWLLSNRFSTQSGSPLNITQATVTLPNGGYTQYAPDLIPGVPIYLHGRAADVNGESVPASWRLNSAAFACVPTTTDTACSGTPVRQGTLGRNYLRNPSFYALNTAVQREFPLYENLRLNFRADAFNLLNHPNPMGADTALTASTFGQLIYGETTTIGAAQNSLYAMGAARSLQFSLKLVF